MCDCVYCRGEKPWSGEPNDWPHTPPVRVFLALQEQDPNLWWRMASGHGQNVAEEALDLCEELANENKSVKEILSDLIAELRDHSDRATLGALGRDKLADCAEARLREIGE